MKILIVSDLSIYALANSYIRGFEQQGYEVKAFDILKTVNKYVRLGKIGKKIHDFWPVEAWIKKGNRELAITFQQYQPDLVMVFGNAPVQYGTLAFFKSVSHCKTVLYWPDTLLNLKHYQQQAASLYDAVATYSYSTIPVFEHIGFKKAVWLPFGGDTDLLGKTNGQVSFNYDITFAGGWRPERERTLQQIAAAVPGIRMQIKGTGWERFCKDPVLKKSCDPHPVYAIDFGNFIRTSRINLNVIDDTNYPAANMRFFEVPAAGGLQLSSRCPEMENIFKDGQEILYFKDEAELIKKIRFVMDNPDQATAIRENAHRFVVSEHVYISRINTLLKFLNTNE